MRRRCITFFEKNLIEPVNNYVNPIIGSEIIGLQYPKVLIRSDGRSVESIGRTQGFSAVLSKEAIKQVRSSRLNNYQSHNNDPFGIGACISFSDLNEGYIDSNPSIAREQYIYGFHALAVGIMSLRLELGQDSNERDIEKEHIVTNQVPLKDFLFATSPKYRDKFNLGLQVPNELYPINQNLPHFLSRKDIENEEKILGWLIENNSQETAKNLSIFLYSQVSEEILKRRLNENEQLVDIVQSLLREDNSNTFGKLNL